MPFSMLWGVSHSVDSLISSTFGSRWADLLAELRASAYRSFTWVSFAGRRWRWVDVHEIGDRR
jgi:hypothetical protein